MSAPAKSERFDMRLLPAHKQLIERAAAVTGQQVTAFAISAMVERAEQVLAQHQVTRLSAADSAAFLRILDRSAPNPGLMKAVRKANRARRA